MIFDEIEVLIEISSRKPEQVTSQTQIAYQCKILLILVTDEATRNVKIRNSLALSYRRIHLCLHTTFTCDLGRGELTRFIWFALIVKHGVEMRVGSHLPGPMSNSILHSVFQVSWITGEIDGRKYKTLKADSGSKFVS